MAIKTGNRSRRAAAAARRGAANWSFLSNHAQVLLCIAADPAMRLREVAQRIGITERAVQRIVAHLVDAGYLSRSRTGRRNQYVVHMDMPLRDPLLAHHQVKQLLNLRVAPPAAAGVKPKRNPPSGGRPETGSRKGSP